MCIRVTGGSLKGLEFNFDIYIMSKFPHTPPHIILAKLTGKSNKEEIGFLRNVSPHTSEIRLKFLDNENWSACIDLVGIAIALSIEIENDGSHYKGGLQRISNTQELMECVSHPKKLDQITN